jgi:hypothetical protein
VALDAIDLADLTNQLRGEMRSSDASCPKTGSRRLPARNVFRGLGFDLALVGRRALGMHPSCCPNTRSRRFTAESALLGLASGWAALR